MDDLAHAHPRRRASDRLGRRVSDTPAEPSPNGKPRRRQVDGWLDHWMATVQDLDRLKDSSPMLDATIDEQIGRRIRVGDRWLTDCSSATRSRWPSCSWTSTTSRPSTTRWAMRRATAPARGGERIRGELRAADTAARLGGDEFAILIEDGGEGIEVADRLMQALLLEMHWDLGQGYFFAKPLEGDDLRGCSPSGRRCSPRPSCWPTAEPDPAAQLSVDDRSLAYRTIGRFPHSKRCSLVVPSKVHPRRS